MASEPAKPEWGTMRGLVALGDSLTYANQSPKLGRLRPQSWALWLAEALELPFTGLAFNGAEATDVLSFQVPRLRGPYELATLGVGSNDVANGRFDVVEFERTLRTVVRAVALHTDRLLFLSLPTSAAERGLRSRYAQVNDLLAEFAAESSASLIAIDDLVGWRLILPDRHPTAVAQLTIAHRAADALRAEGVPLPTALPDPESAVGPFGMYQYGVIERPILALRNLIGRNLANARRRRIDQRSEIN